MGSRLLSGFARGVCGATLGPRAVTGISGAEPRPRQMPVLVRTGRESACPTTQPRGSVRVDPTVLGDRHAVVPGSAQPGDLAVQDVGQDVLDGPLVGRAVPAPARCHVPVPVA